MDVSVIIAMYNAKSTIKNCVKSILNSDFRRPYEIIVVDDGSTDCSADKIKDLKVRLVRQRNMGAAAARNNGARHAKSELLLFVDSDVEFCKDALRKLYHHLSKKDVDFVTPMYSRIPINKRWINKYKALADHCYYYRFIFPKDQLKKPIRQVSLGGGVDGIKKRVFDTINGYDEKIKGAGVEKEIMYIKLFSDYNVLADPNINTRHNFPGFRSLVKNYFYRTIDSMELMHNRGYKAQNLKRNTKRVLIGFLAPVVLLLTIVFSLFLSTALPLLFAVLLFFVYIWLHLDMFIISLKDNGPAFMIYTLIMNMFFCSVISIAGLIGIINVVLKK